MTTTGDQPYHEAREPWTDTRVQKLTQLYRMGYSASQIAKRLGGVTRNAVIGKCGRLGLVRSSGNKPAYQLQARIDGRLTNKLRRRGGPKKQKPKLAILPTAAEAAVSHVALNLSLLDLGPNMCRWPTSEDRPHLFCGVACEGTYCSHHAPLATVPTFRKIRVPTDRGDRSWRTFDLFEKEAA